MDNFTITGDSQLQIKIAISSIYKADTKVDKLQGNVLEKPSVAASESFGNGNIDLDANRHLIWKQIGSSTQYKGKTLLFITTLYGTPPEVNSDELALEFVKQNIGFTYGVKENILEASFKLSSTDIVAFDSYRTLIIYKKIQIV